MQKVSTFDTAFDGRKTADDRAARVPGLGLAIRHVWARLLEFPTSECAVGATRADFEEEARKTHRAREVAVAKDTVLIALSIL